jgi:hypothetical protein
MLLLVNGQSAEGIAAVYDADNLELLGQLSMHTSVTHRLQAEGTLRNYPCVHPTLETLWNHDYIMAEGTTGITDAEEQRAVRLSACILSTVFSWAGDETVVLSFESLVPLYDARSESTVASRSKVGETLTHTCIFKAADIVCTLCPGVKALCADMEVSYQSSR